MRTVQITIVRTKGEREKLGTQVLILPICKISMIVVEIDSFAGRDSKLTNKTVNVAELV